jgi:hypothetical protein
MAWPAIVKQRADRGVASQNLVAPNLDDYEQVYAHFSWEKAAEWLVGLPAERGVNIAHASQK